MRTIDSEKFTQQLSTITHVKVYDSPYTHVEASDSTNTQAVLRGSNNLSLNDLPAEIISHILSLSSPSTIRNFGSTPRINWLIAQDNQTWKNLLLVDGCGKILINALRENGFTNTDIFACFPLLQNEQFNFDLSWGITIPFRPRVITITPMNIVSSLKSWPIYLIPAEIISAISNRFTLIRLNKQSDLQKNQSFSAIAIYISELSRVFAITDHRIITIFIQALSYLTCDDLLKIIRSFPGQQKDPVLRIHLKIHIRSIYRNIQKYAGFLTQFVELFEEYLKLINKLTVVLDVDYIFAKQQRLKPQHQLYRNCQ